MSIETRPSGKIVKQDGDGPGWHFNIRLYDTNAETVAAWMAENALKYGVTLFDPDAIKSHSNRWA